MRIATIVLSLIFLISCNSTPEKEDDIEHLEGLLQETENDLYSLPDEFHGLTQSPVNILTTSLEKEKIHEVEVINPHCQAIDVVNKGHTVHRDTF